MINKNGITPTKQLQNCCIAYLVNYVKDYISGINPQFAHNVTGVDIEQEEDKFNIIFQFKDGSVAAIDFHEAEYRFNEDFQLVAQITARRLKRVLIEKYIQKGNEE